MVNTIRKFERKTKRFFQLWKGFAVLTLLLSCIPHHLFAHTGTDTLKASIDVNVYVSGGALIYSSEEYTNAKIVFQNSEEKRETKIVKKLLCKSSDSFQKNRKKKSAASVENRLQKCPLSLVNRSEEKLSQLFRTYSLLLMPVSYSSGIKGIFQKYDSAFSLLFYLYSDIYFTPDHLCFNKYVLASQSIRPPPGLV